jgi:hypothetical protein
MQGARGTAPLRGKATVRVHLPPLARAVGSGDGACRVNRSRLLVENSIPRTQSGDGLALPPAEAISSLNRSISSIDRE